MEWVNLLLLLLFSHAGLVVLALVAGGLLAGRRTIAAARSSACRSIPSPERSCSSSRSRRCSSRRCWPCCWGARHRSAVPEPIVVLSGLAVIVAAGDVIRLYRQRIGALVWLGLLVVPPAVIVAATVTLPWTAAVDLEVSKPANAMGQFFTETFRRRTGKPLAIVIGDARTAGLVALASPDRPSLYVDGLPARSPWLSDAAVAEKGAIITWTATDAARHAAARAEGALPRYGAGSAALVRPLGAGAPAAAAHRLGDDPAALTQCSFDCRQIALDRLRKRLLGAALDHALEEVAEHLVECERLKRSRDRLHALRRKRHVGSDSCA